MNTTNMARIAPKVLSETIETMIGAAATSFALSVEVQERLTIHPVARLISAIPYLANCRIPERAALAHLFVYLGASGRSGMARVVFDHDTFDDSNVLARLKPISHFDGGDKQIIERGMNLLALVMVEGYRRDLEKDRATGGYNPALAGVWNVDEIEADLTTKINSVSCPQMDEILSPADAIKAYWGWP